jgi:hypothetical protein
MGAERAESTAFQPVNWRAGRYLATGVVSLFRGRCLATVLYATICTTETAIRFTIVMSFLLFSMFPTFEFNSRWLQLASAKGSKRRYHLEVIQERI